MSAQSPSKARSFTKDAAAVFSSRVAKIGITFVSGVLLARLLGPEGKGILAAVSIYPTLIISIAEMGVRQAAVHHLGKKVYPEREVVGTVMSLLLLSSLLGVAICASIYVLIDNPNFTVPMMVLALAAIPLGLALTMSQGILLGKEQIGKFSTIGWTSQLLRLFGILVFVWLLGWGVVGEMVGSLLTGGIMAGYAFWLVARYAELNVRFAPKIAKELLSLGSIYALALVTASLNYKADIVLLERLSSPEAIGQYTLGVNISELLWQLPAALGVVIFSRSANTKDRKGHTSSVAKLMRVSLVVALLGAVGLALTAGYLIPFVYSEAFRPSVEIIRLLLPGIVAITIWKILNTDLAGRGRPVIALTTAIPAVIINVVLNLLWIPRYGANGAAVASAISYTVCSLLLLVVYAKVTQLPLSDLLRYRASDFHFLRKFLPKGLRK